MSYIEGNLRGEALKTLIAASRHPDQIAARTKLESNIEGMRKKVAATAWDCVPLFGPGISSKYQFPTPVVLLDDSFDPRFGSFQTGVSLHFAADQNNGHFIPNEQRFENLMFYVFPLVATFKGLFAIEVLEKSGVVKRKGIWFGEEQLKPRNAPSTREELVRIKHMNQVVGKVTQRLSSCRS